MKIKICGITNIEDAQLAVALGATHIGLNFYPKSPRYITKQKALDITGSIRQLATPPVIVGIFVNKSEKSIRTTIKDTGLDLAQLHGDEPHTLIKNLGKLAYKAYRLGKDNIPSQIPQLCLVDAYVKGKYGGGGTTTDWEKAALIAKKTHVFLAGGLTPENISEAIKHVQPWGVDVASGVESEPGIKDPNKIQRFIENTIHSIQHYNINDDV